MVTKNTGSIATSAQVRRAIKGVESAGIIVDSVKLYPDGTIELVSSGSASGVTPANDFDRLDKLGQL